MPCRQPRALLLLMAISSCVLASDASSGPAEGRLIPGCEDPDTLASLTPADRERYCRWVVRFRRDTRVRAFRSEEQLAVESALGELEAVQPAQIEGDRASVLAQRKSGEFTVVSLEKRGGAWTAVRVTDPSASRGRLVERTRKR
jgi:hypothetical protein